MRIVGIARPTVKDYSTLTPGSSQPEVFNVLGQLQTIERVEEERKALGHEKKKAISETPKYGKQG